MSGLRERKTEYGFMALLRMAAPVMAALVVCAVFAMCSEVLADSRQGGSGWTVQFDGGQMVSSFHTDEIADAVYALQPGDDVTFYLTVQNTSDVTTDWYMTNEVLRSLEDTQAVAANGGYSYVLTYYNEAGEAEELYGSESVGGEKSTAAGEGLNEATDSLKDYFFLDRLVPGQSGGLTLFVSLDGESQGNVYQDTLADLQMNFAVELVTDTTIVPKSKLPEDYPFIEEDGGFYTTSGGGRKTIINVVDQVVTVFRSKAAKTGDKLQLVSIVLLVLGVGAACAALLLTRSGRKGADRS